MEEQNLDQLYQEIIIDHFKHPRGKGHLINPTCKKQLYNPLCGDEITIEMQVKGDKVENMLFSGKGCAISQASASMMIELCKGKNINEVKQIWSKFISMMKGKMEADQAMDLGDAVALEGVRRFSSRIKCALLGWEALKECLSKLEQET